MSRPLRAGLQLRTMHYADLDRVLAVECAAYSFPWTRGNFVDSLSAGYLAKLLVDAGNAVVGYYVAMAGVDEMHLLNLTVAPDRQGQGHSHVLLDALEQRCRDGACASLWLEVRASNARARQVYARRGFAEAGLRRGYYPAGQAPREDAIVMRLAVGRG